MKQRQKKPSLLSRAERVMHKLNCIRNITDIEKSFIAMGLAATPEERWQINQFFLQRLPPAAKRLIDREVLISARKHEKLQNIG
jgi:hypothetical protein